MGLLFLGRFDIVRLHSICQSLQPSAAFAIVATGPEWMSPPGRNPHGNDHDHGAIAMFRIYTASRSLYKGQKLNFVQITDWYLGVMYYGALGVMCYGAWYLTLHVTCMYFNFQYFKHADFRSAFFFCNF